MDKSHIFMKVAVALIALCGTAICAAGFPAAVYVAVGKLFEPWSREFTLCYSFELAFLLLSALPCYAIVVYLWKTSELIGRGRLFCDSAVKYFAASARLLFVDVIFFLVGNLVFYFIGANCWLWLYLFLDVCAVAVALVFVMVSKCLKEAAILQDESDCTL